MKLCCCDSNNLKEPLESFIQDNNLDIYIEDYYPEVRNLCELKNKIICDFLDIVNKLECGILPDLEFLLLEISLIDIYDN